MKISAVIISRNDNYGGHLNERATYCLNSAIDTYDEVFYVDWNSPTNSLLYDIKDNIKFKGNLKHFVITPEVASILTNHTPDAQKCCEVLARNIGLRRATGDWLISTNIDIIHPKREDLEKVILESDGNTFYTLGRRNMEWDWIKEFHNGEIIFDKWKELREYYISNSSGSFHLADLVDDQYSLIACCGDYQIAPRKIWESIRGFEEELIYPGCTDTNIQKKVVVHGFNIKAIYEPAMFHIAHGTGGGGFMDFDKFGQKNPKYQDYYRAIIYQQKTENSESWGFGDTEIEFEIF